MYQLTKPFVDYTNAQFESFCRLAQPSQSGVMQADAMTQMIKTSIENYSRLVQESTRTFSTFVLEAQEQMSRGMQESAQGMKQAAQTSSIIVGETVEKMNDTAQELSGEIEVANARAAARRRP